MRSLNRTKVRTRTTFNNVVNRVKNLNIVLFAPSKNSVFLFNHSITTFHFLNMK